MESKGWNSQVPLDGVSRSSSRSQFKRVRSNPDLNVIPDAPQWCEDATAPESGSIPKRMVRIEFKMRIAVWLSFAGRGVIGWNQASRVANQISLRGWRGRPASGRVKGVQQE
jgi:hypothetical protein